MTTNVSVFIATSLDGFVASPDGGIAWLEEANASVPRGEDCGYKAFIDTVDTIVVGSNTFRQVLKFPEWPYVGKRVVVLSTRQGAFAESLLPDVTVVSEAPEALVKRLSVEGARHLYVDGGVTIQSFLRSGLVSDLIITAIPVLLGAGRSLFGALDTAIKLTHVATTSYSFGFVQSKYRVEAK